MDVELRRLRHLVGVLAIAAGLVGASTVVALAGTPAGAPGHDGSAVVAPSALGSGWSVRPSVDAARVDTSWTGVSCATPRQCVAVGTAVDAQGTTTPAAAVWSGGVWRLTAVPNPGGGNNGIAAVSCPTASMCMAVGGTNRPATRTGLLAEVWNGDTWAVSAVPMVAGAFDQRLSGVSCVSATHCVAVGDAQEKGGSRTVPLVATWRGRSWTVRTLDNTGAPGGELTAISCVSVTSCVAVGQYRTTSSVLAEVWNGSRWSAYAPPTSTVETDLDAVTCRPNGHCLAVGETFHGSGTRSLIERWDGSTWTRVPVPTPLNSGLDGIACPTALGCTAVGNVDGQPFSLRRTASGWQSSRPPRLGDVRYNALFAVSCASATECTAVGSGTPGGATYKTIVDRLDGQRWSRQQSPNVHGALDTEPVAVSCARVNACMVVGSSSSVDRSRPFAESWDGNRWVTEPTPSTYGSGDGQTGAVFTSVSCPSADVCVAVGAWKDRHGTTRPLVERWNGHSWRVQRTPTIDRYPAALAGVSCTSPRSCLAVGNVDGGYPLAERWNGHTWSGFTDVGVIYGRLIGVDCITASDCIAVGTGGEDGRPLVDQWTGGDHWTDPVQPALPADLASTALSGISCPSATSCTAVGGVLDREGREDVFVDHWNGTSWTYPDLASPSTRYSSVLTAVSCVGTACDAVGAEVTGLERGVAVSERSSGSHWTLPTTAQPRHNWLSALLGVSCRQRCVAAGTEISSYNTRRGLIETTSSS